MQEQSIELLDYRIASWKDKYKKLLDNPSPNFKKELNTYLLNTILLLPNTFNPKLNLMRIKKSKIRVKL